MGSGGVRSAVERGAQRAGPQGPCLPRPAASPTAAAGDERRENEQVEVPPEPLGNGSPAARRGH